MNDEFMRSLWDALQSAEGDNIPWSAMEALAEALAVEPDLIERLLDAYDTGRDAVLDRACYVHLYVPAVFALAAPKLSEGQRREIGESLIARLIEAGEQDDHLMMEVLVGACGAMGPAILPLVFGVVMDEVASSGAWCQLWGLTKLAAGSDRSLQDRVAAACVALLERIGRDEVEFELGVEAAWTLASLGRLEHAELLRRLENTSRWTLAYPDYSGARRTLEGRQECPLPQELWEMPVQDWFEPRWQRTRDWLVMRDSAARNWEALQATYTAEPFVVAPIPIVAYTSGSAGKNSRYADVRL